MESWRTTGCIWVHNILYKITLVFLKKLGWVHEMKHYIYVFFSFKDSFLFIFLLLLVICLLHLTRSQPKLQLKPRLSNLFASRTVASQYNLSLYVKKPEFSKSLFILHFSSNVCNVPINNLRSLFLKFTLPWYPSVLFFGKKMIDIAKPKPTLCIEK